MDRELHLQQGKASWRTSQHQHRLRNISPHRAARSDETLTCEYSIHCMTYVYTPQHPNVSTTKIQHHRIPGYVVPLQNPTLPMHLPLILHIPLQPRKSNLNSFLCPNRPTPLPLHEINPVVKRLVCALFAELA